MVSMPSESAGRACMVIPQGEDTGVIGVELIALGVSGGQPTHPDWLKVSAPRNYAYHRTKSGRGS